MQFRLLKKFFASLFLGLLFFVAFSPSDVHAESCALSGTPELNVGDTITVLATDFINPNLFYQIEILNTTTGERTTLSTFIPNFGPLPQVVTIPFVSAGTYQLRLVGFSLGGTWDCANGALTISGSPPPPPPPTPMNFLNVTSTGVSGVFIDGSQPGTSNSTNYTVAISTDIDTFLTAPDPDPVSGRAFLSWSGCAVGPANVCHAIVTGGGNFTVTANYAAATAPPSTLNFLHVTSVVHGIPISGSQAGTSGSTNYTVATSSDIDTVLTAPLTWAGQNFVSWSNCASSGNQCFAKVSASIGGTWTVTANYASAPPPAGGGGGGGGGGSGGGSGPTCSISNSPAQISDIVCIIERIIGILAPVAAIIFFIMVVMGAFRFIKSAGDPKKIANARDTLKYAIFGVILVVAAWLILLLIKQVTGVNVTSVNIP